MSQLTALVEAICKDFRGHDEGEIRRLVEWQRVMKTRRRNTCRCFACMDRSMGCSSKTALIVRYLGMP